MMNPKDPLQYKILAIDSSGPAASAAVYDHGVLLADCMLNYKKKHSTTLMPMVDAVVSCAELDLHTLDAVAVTAGPGSFTGLRIGSATAKGLALALDIPVIPVPTLAALACNMYGRDGIICPVMDARRAQVYNALYEFENGKLKERTQERAVPVAELLAELDGIGKPVHFLGDGVPVYEHEIREHLHVPFSFAPAQLNLQRAGSTAVLGAELFAAGIFESADEHTPFYLRKSQAEQQKERAEAAGRTEELARGIAPQ